MAVRGGESVYDEETFPPSYGGTRPLRMESMESGYEGERTG